MTFQLITYAIHYFFFINLFVYKKDKNKISLKIAFKTGFSLVNNQVNFFCVLGKSKWLFIVGITEDNVGIKDKKALITTFNLQMQ